MSFLQVEQLTKVYGAGDAAVRALDGGSLAVERVSEGMPRGEARRLGLMCAGVSPVYLVGGVGAALFGSAAMGLCSMSIMT